MSYTPSRPVVRSTRKSHLLIGILIGLIAGWLLVGQLRGNGLHRNATPRAIIPRGDLIQQEKTTIEIFQQAAPSVVYITSLSRRTAFIGFEPVTVRQEGTGSGFIWDKDGHVVTNFHVIRGAQRVKVILADHSSWNATRVGIEPDKDLAVLEIEAPASRLRPIAIGTSHDLQVGQSVLAIGNPFGLDQTLTSGIVSALGRTIQSVSKHRIENVVQTDAAINPGNSGGPLLDSAGRLIGVNTMIVSKSGGSAGIGFAVPVDTVNKVVPQLIKYGHTVRPRLGVVLAPENILRQAEVEGVLILSVQPGSGADQAGLRGTVQTAAGNIILGDIITGVDGETANSTDDILSILERHKAGDKVKITYRRGDKTRTAQVTLQAPAFTE